MDAQNPSPLISSAPIMRHIKCRLIMCSLGSIGNCAKSIGTLFALTGSSHLGQLEPSGHEPFKAFSLTSGNALRFAHLAVWRESACQIHFRWWVSASSQRVTFLCSPLFAACLEGALSTLRPGKIEEVPDKAAFFLNLGFRSQITAVISVLICVGLCQTKARLTGSQSF